MEVFDIILKIIYVVLGTAISIVGIAYRIKKDLEKNGLLAARDEKQEENGDNRLKMIQFSTPRTAAPPQKEPLKTEGQSELKDIIYNFKCDLGTDAPSMTECQSELRDIIYNFKCDLDLQAPHLAEGRKRPEEPKEKPEKKRSA